MKTISNPFVRAASACAIAMLLAAPVATRADAPAAPSASAEPAQITGTVVDFHGKYGLVVRDERGALVDVVMHQGTVIEPVGLRLERGMRVTILGSAQERTLAANRIVTSYSVRNVVLARPPRVTSTDWPPRGSRSVRDDALNPNPGNPGAARVGQ